MGASLRRERWNLVLCAAFTWALWPVHLYFRDQIPGSGPDGGEAIFTLLATTTLAWTALTAANAERLAKRLGARFWMRAFLAPLAGVAATVLAFCVFVWLEPADIGSFAVGAAAFLLPNLILLVIGPR
jgi:hypothetical protein